VRAIQYRGAMVVATVGVGQEAASRVAAAMAAVRAEGMEVAETGGAQAAATAVDSKMCQQSRPRS